MNEVIKSDDIKIENLIYEIRGKQVMIDSDLAKLYHVETKRINEAVKNNLNKFPERFSWILMDDEWMILRSKFSTSSLSKNNYGGRRYNPRVFTEQGVAMLATILKSNVATYVSIAIMDAFVAMKNYIGSNLIEQKYINNMVLDNNEQIKEIRNDVKLLQESFDKLKEKKKVNEVYFNGQIYDAYAKIKEILNISKKKLVIIDSYADSTILDIIKRLNVNVIIITKKDNLLSSEDIVRYNKQYYNLRVVYDNTFHDRYFIIDDNIVYHCGTSINRIGYKTFSINLINDKEVCKILIDRVNKIIN